jgi:hypothetical protein
MLPFLLSISPAIVATVGGRQRCTTVQGSKRSHTYMQAVTHLHHHHIVHLWKLALVHAAILVLRRHDAGYKIRWFSTSGNTMHHVHVGKTMHHATSTVLQAVSFVLALCAVRVAPSPRNRTKPLKLHSHDEQAVKTHCGIQTRTTSDEMLVKATESTFPAHMSSLRSGWC